MEKRAFNRPGPRSAWQDLLEERRTQLGLDVAAAVGAASYRRFRQRLN